MTAPANLRTIIATLLLLAGCAGPAAADPPEPRYYRVPGTPRIQSYFATFAFDTRCDYPRPIAPGESLARYVEEIADQQKPGLTDLGCFSEGRRDPSPAAGMSTRYYYANAFLLVKERGSLDGLSLGELVRTTGLDQVSPNGEISYFFAEALLAENINCAHDFAVAAYVGGISDGGDLVETLNRRGTTSQPACQDPLVLSLLERSPHPPRGGRSPTMSRPGDTGMTR